MEEWPWWVGAWLGERSVSVDGVERGEPSRRVSWSLLSSSFVLTSFASLPTLPFPLLSQPPSHFYQTTCSPPSPTPPPSLTPVPPRSSPTSTSPPTQPFGSTPPSSNSSSSTTSISPMRPEGSNSGQRSCSPFPPRTTTRPCSSLPRSTRPTCSWIWRYRISPCRTTLLL